VTRAQAIEELLRRLVDELDGLMAESSGVAGLHLNGDLADWAWLSGAWLPSHEKARAALAQPEDGADPNEIRQALGDDRLRTSLDRALNLLREVADSMEARPEDPGLQVMARACRRLLASHEKGGGR
jgi:hypothetical protein